MTKQTVFESIESESEQLNALSRDIWETPELGLYEHESANAFLDVFETEGFSITRDVAGMSTAFVASYGDGSPAVGVLGEYDALPGLSQTTHPDPAPREEGAPGHGCGHNLLGTGCAGAALGVKRAIEAGELDGTIKFFGCPAEELLVGKIYMAREGVFDGLDIALTWHPSDITRLLRDSSLAMDSIQFTFDGTAAHAAIDPESGRSALDAVQLMNTGVEHMREHTPDSTLVHYNITDGGDAPNVVPSEATVWYFVRGPSRKHVERITNWIRDIAEGAAIMTQTTVNERYLTGCYRFLPNETVSDAVWDNVQVAGPIDYTREERDQAVSLQKTLADEEVEKTIDNLPENDRARARDSALYGEPVETLKEGGLAGSSDVGDVSWIVPTAWLYATTYPVGTPAHSWQAVASSGSFGLRSVTYTAKILGGTIYDIMTDESIVEAAWQEFERKTSGRSYKSPLPSDAEPPFDISGQ